MSWCITSQLVIDKCLLIITNKKLKKYDDVDHNHVWLLKFMILINIYCDREYKYLIYLKIYKVAKFFCNNFLIIISILVYES